MPTILEHPKYVGRFAPSPTGPLHFGSVIAALGSYLCARSRGGEWLVRIDDIDPPREVPGAIDAILRTLEALGLEWDRSVFFQSHHRDRHRAACDDLLASQCAYRCRCSRKQIGERPYPGTCRALNLNTDEVHAVRVQVSSDDITVVDHVQGAYRQNLVSSGGDFIVWRAEDSPAYHLATVVDDAALGVTEVVRGVDLLESTPRQYFLQCLLGQTHPSYRHLPLVLDDLGRKLSKQAEAAPIAALPVTETLSRALAFLGHPVPTGLTTAPAAELLAWARTAWQPENIPAASARFPAPDESRACYPLR